MSRCTVRGDFFIGLILAFGAAMTQADDNRGEPSRTPLYSAGHSKLIWLLTKPGVQKELGLDDSESQKLLASLREIDPTNVSLQTREERQEHVAVLKAMIDETTQKSEEAIQRSLSEEQLRRFEQLKRQHLGGRALLNPETARQLALTAEQDEKLKEIRREFQSGVPKEISEKFQSDLLAVLTPEQSNQWKEMTGAPFKAPKSFGGVPWELISVPEVHKEIGLSEDEAATLMQSLAAIRNEVSKERGQELFRSNRTGQPPADRMLPFQQIVDTVRSSLTVLQWNRLQELILQDAGIESLEHPEVARQLGLSRDQRDRARETIKEYRRVSRDRTQKVNAEEKRTRQKQEQVDLLEILTPDQTKQWEVMQGAKVDLQSLTRPRPGISRAGN